MRQRIVPLALAVALASAGPAVAGAITDPAGDFLPSYSGPHNLDMDVLAVTAGAGSNILHLAGTLAGPLGVTPGALYVFGVGRGTGLAPFGAFQPGVLFDAVVIGRADGTGFVRDLITSAVTNLPGSAIHVAGASIEIDVPLDLLPSHGLTVGQYEINLWPRQGLGSNDQISDFAPDNAVFAVPEPATLGFLSLVLAGLGLTRARRQPR